MWSSVVVFVFHVRVSYGMEATWNLQQQPLQWSGVSSIRRSRIGSYGEAWPGEQGNAGLSNHEAKRLQGMRSLLGEWRAQEECGKGET